MCACVPIPKLTPLAPSRVKFGRPLCSPLSALLPLLPPRSVSFSFLAESSSSSSSSSSLVPLRRPKYKLSMASISSGHTFEQKRKPRSHAGGTFSPFYFPILMQRNCPARQIKSQPRFYLCSATAISHRINKPPPAREREREREWRAAIKSVKFHRIT